MKKFVYFVVVAFIGAIVLSSCSSAGSLGSINKYEGKMWKKKFKQQKQVENCW